MDSKDQKIADLERELQKYKAAAEGASDGLWDWDVLNDETFISKPWLQMLGLNDKIQDHNNFLWHELLHPEDKDYAIEQFDKIRAGEIEKYREEFRLRHTDGSYRWILSKAKALKNDKGEVIRISGSHTDITERKRIIAELEKSEEKYRNLFQNTLMPIVSCELETMKIVEGNDKFWELVGHNKKGKSLLSFFDRNEANRLHEQLLNGEQIEKAELKLDFGESKEAWISLSMVAFPEDNLCQCILADITETRENLDELQKVNFELDSFVYHASHDLRSPLRSILGLIDLYRIEEAQEIKDECVEKIEGSVKRLDDLVMKLLSLSRNDRVNDPHVEISLMNEINNSITSYYNASDTRNLEIITKIKQTLPFVSDLTRIRIILNNLISNAIKYRSRNKEKSKILIEAEVFESYTTIKIEDNGEGIEESKLSHIFDMFYRATEQSEGSGLGLYIVKKVAEKLNASIEVESVELEGTSFTVTIPNTLTKEYVST